MFGRCEILVKTTLTSWKIKPLSPIRSSDRRKIADQIISSFSIDISINSSQAKEPDDEALAAVTVGGVRNSLLPEGSLSARFTTTTGPNLDQVSGIVYVGSHPGQEQRILWIKVEERFIPSGGLV